MRIGGDFAELDAVAAAEVFLPAGPLPVLALEPRALQADQRLFAALGHLAALAAEQVDLVARHVEVGGVPAVERGEGEESASSAFAVVGGGEQAVADEDEFPAAAEADDAAAAGAPEVLAIALGDEIRGVGVAVIERAVAQLVREARARHLGLRA